MIPGQSGAGREAWIAPLAAITGLPGSAGEHPGKYETLFRLHGAQKLPNDLHLVSRQRTVRVNIGPP